MKRVHYIILFYLINHLTLFSQKANEWKLTRNEEGVKIYIRNVEGSRTKEVLGLTQIKTHLAALVSMVKDPDNHHLWIYANKSAKLLYSFNDFEWIYYNISEAPWPVSNRDLITHALMKQDKSTYKVIIYSNGKPDYIPHKKDLVRVPKLTSVWEFTPQSDGIVDVRFELTIDLGGDIPAWLVNMAIDKGPFNTLLNMSKVVKTSKYADTYLSYIMEKP